MERRRNEAVSHEPCTRDSELKPTMLDHGHPGCRVIRNLRIRLPEPDFGSTSCRDAGAMDARWMRLRSRPVPLVRGTPSRTVTATRAPIHLPQSARRDARESPPTAVLCAQTPLVPDAKRDMRTTQGSISSSRLSRTQRSERSDDPMRLAMDSSRTPTLLFRQTRFTKILVEICRTFEDLDFRVVVSPRRPTRRKGGRERCLDNKVEEICLQHGIAEGTGVSLE